MDVSTNSVLLGEIKQFHTFNGAIPVPRGFMICNGQVINESNYDAIHGAGSYVADGIADLVLNGKYTPNLVNKYVVGASSTTQDGSSAISSVGNSNHQVNLSHSHTVNSHNHQWYKGNSFGNDDTTFNSAGVSQNLNQGTSVAAESHIMQSEVGSEETLGDAYTSNASPGTSSSGSSTQNIQPESIQVMYIIRVGI